nr:DNA helicase [Tanacetum cinerariifolium]
MKTKRKLVPKSYPFTEDSNVVSSDVGHRVYDCNSTVSPKKQCLDGFSRISFPTVDVSFYGVRNITNISDDVVPSTDIGQLIAMLDRCDALPDTGNYPFVVAISAQPEYVVSNSSGPRYMYNHYQDALAIFRVHGNPSYFITFTCNVNWPEISEYMRGLPRCHTLLWIDESIRVRRDEHIDTYTKRKLVPKSYPFIEDSNVVSFDVSHQVYDGNSIVSPQKQCLDGSSRISFPAIDVSFYGVWNITNISDDVVSSTDIRQPIAISQNYPSVVAISAQPKYVVSNSINRSRGRRSRSKHNPPITSGTSSATSAQPEYVVSNSGNHSRGRRNRSKHNPPVTSGTSSTTSAQLEYILSSSNNRSRDLKDYMLYEFETCLNHCSKSLTDFGLRSPPAHLMFILRNRLLMEEKSYDRQLLAIERDNLLPKLNESQCQIFNLIVNACLNNEQRLVFVYGHGGTGKTFLWKTILYTLRCERKIVLAVASSGIASLLLPAVMLGGDFRQTLPVKGENMRLNNKSLSEIDKHRTATFAQWLLDVGNGQIGIPDDSDPDKTSWVDIPEEYCIPNDDNAIPNFINFIYDADTLRYPSAQKLQEKAIVYPKNDMADIINDKILSLHNTNIFKPR